MGDITRCYDSCDVCLNLLQRRKEEERHKVNVQKEKERYQEKLWAFISKKEIPKVRDMLEIQLDFNLPPCGGVEYSLHVVECVREDKLHGYYYCVCVVCRSKLLGVSPPDRWLSSSAMLGTTSSLITKG